MDSTTKSKQDAEQNSPANRMSGSGSKTKVVSIFSSQDGLNQGQLLCHLMSATQQVKLTSQVSPMVGSIDTSPGPTTPMSTTDVDKEVLTTPPPQCPTICSDCSKIGRKSKRVKEDLSSHSRWETLLQMAENKSTEDECSAFLKSMELENSDDEMIEEEFEEIEEEVEEFSLTEAGVVAND